MKAFAATCLAGALWCDGAARAAERTIDFVREVQPIFEAKCVKCHGPEKQKGGFRLDRRSVAMSGGDHFAPNILPGRSADSPLFQFVAGLDDDMKMPPKGEPLSAAQIEVLRAWIDAGAPWPEDAAGKGGDPLDWWSLKPLAKSAGVPSIDVMVSAKLMEKGLAMSQRADARTLFRRLYFDLIGLPPTPEEVQAFVDESHGSHESYEHLVDRLLASPRYGERWARHWLDVVHYGDTHGFDKDKPRPNAWPYRDYVIRALNADKPYARFVQEQLAGDVLFPGTRDGIEALGFIASGPWDFIGHEELPESKLDGKIARHLDRDDMVATAMGTFASVTAHCAQCHNHKFDPISQEDYYSLQAVFAAVDRTEVKYYQDDETQTRAQRWQRDLREAEQALTAFEAPLKKMAGEPFAALDRRIAGASTKTAAKQGNTSPDYGYHSALASTAETTKWVQVELGQRADITRVTLLPCYDDFNAIGAGFGFPVRFKVEASDDPEFRDGVQLFWTQHDKTFMADFPNPGLASFSTNAGAEPIAGRYVRVTATRLAPRKGDFIFALAELQVFDAAGTNLAMSKAVTAADSIEAPPRWRKSNLTDGIAPVAQSADELAKLREEREALLLSVADETTKAKRAGLLAETRRIGAELGKLPPPRAVYAGAIRTGSGNFRGTGADGGKPRPIFLLQRGQITQPGREVRPGALSTLTFCHGRFDLAPDAGEGERRAALARWLTDPQNPLTWRSIVNRVWQHHFGHGLVETANDFGHMGALPSHPELLDALAVWFRDDAKGSLKALHKLIVMSATYRQSAADNPAAAKMDANNTLLWRQNRRKLEAEAIRDAVLAVSGKLDLTMGGPGWQDFVIEQPQHSPHYRYDLADPEDAKTWRRSIYRFIVRSQTQPWMTALDCADPSMRVDRRNESVSAPQALALLNNGFMLTQAQHFAARVQRDAPDLVAQVERAHALAFGRAPSPTERDKLLAFAESNGLPQICRVLLNLNEFAFID